MQIGPLRLLFESRSGSRIWAGKNKMSKSKKRTLILLDTNSPATAAGRFRFTWSGKDSESQRKTGNKTYKKECRAEVGAFDTTSLTLIRWQNPTPWKSHFSPMQRWLFGLFPTCTFLPFVGVMTLTPPTTSEANFYLFTSDCYFCSEIHGVTWHSLRQIHSCFPYPCAHRSDTRLGHWEWSKHDCWSYVELNCLLPNEGQCIAPRSNGPMCWLLDFVV